MPNGVWWTSVLLSTSLNLLDIGDPGRLCSHRHRDYFKPSIKADIVLSVRRPIQKLFASILIVFMLNTLSWSVSAMAFADWVASEQGSQATGEPDGNTADTGFPDDCGKHCNEGCHVFSHLQGLVQATAVCHPTLDSFVIPGSLNSPGDRAPGGLFRPPRSSVLA